ncbi:AraC family transcriptional regulator [Streptomyces sp. NPDC002688]|uniref:helix-turn-helix transcriptional regulator n=1 Tax=Streptomyces sp. NPDC002688 TaxID=3154423 RepID=UPI00332E5E91
MRSKTSAGNPCTSDEIDLVSAVGRHIFDLAALGLAPLLALGHYRYREARPALPPQRHQRLLGLAFPARGEVAFTVDGEPHPVRPGQVLRIPPGHAYQTGEVQPRGELWWLILHYDSDAEDALGQAIAALCGEPGPLIGAAPLQAASSLARAAELAGREPRRLAESLLHHHLSALVLELALTPPATTPPAGHPDVARALTWLEEHLGDPVQAADLTAVSGMSTSRFYEAFTAETGTSPKDYLLRRKTEFARAWLLRDPATPVTKIAHALGFSSSQHFATVFRRYQGAAPSQLRSQ